MGTNFLNPQPTNNYLDILTDIVAFKNSAALMYDGTGDTNYPINAIKYNSSNQQWQKFDGTNWNIAPIGAGALAAGSVVNATLAANAVDDTKIRLRSQGWLRSLNAAGNADISLLQTDASDNTVLNAFGGKNLNFAIGGTVGYYLDNSATFQPNGDLAKSLGSGVTRFLNVYAQNLQKVQAVQGDGANMIIGPTDAHTLQFQANGAGRWYIDTNGDFVPNTGGVNVGRSGFMAGTVFAANLQATAGDLLVKAFGNLSLASNNAGTAQWILDSSGIFRPVSNNVSNIGAAAFMVSTVYAQALFGGTGVDLWVEAPSGQQLSLGAGGALKWDLGSTGHLVPRGTYNIGSAGNRVNTVFAGAGGLDVAGAYILTNLIAGRGSVGTFSNQGLAISVSGSTFYIPLYS